MPTPLWINASAGSPSYNANTMRQAMALPVMYGGRAVGARAGVRPGGTQLQASLVGSTITVQPGVALVDPALTTTQGSYWACVPTAETHTLTVADPANPRKDIIVMRVYDHDEDLSGLRLARTEYLVGTAAATPAEPSVPAGAFRLATIDVPKVGAGSASVTNNAPFTVASGGILPVRNQAERDALTSSASSGLTVWRRDRNWAETHDGTAWRVQGVAIVFNTGELTSVITNPYFGQVALNTSDAQLYRFNGIGWFPQAPFAFKPGDESIVSTATTLQDDDHLTVSLETNRIYDFVMHLIVNSPAAADIKFAWTAPAGAIMSYDVHVTEAPGPTGSLLGPYTESSTVALATVGTDQIIRVEGLIRVSTPGTLRLRWAPNTSAAGNTIVKTNSYLKLLGVR